MTSILRRGWPPAVVEHTAYLNRTCRRRTMRNIALVALMSLMVAAGAANSSAQTAGSTLVSVEVAELREVAAGWSAKKQILGKDVYNDAGDKIGEVNDLIVTPSRSLSYAIVGVGGFLGIGEHNVAVPVSRFKQLMGKITLPGATKDALKAAPKFEYAQ
jgi:sporulation protein YlmC with PRC-barrel domain